MISLLKSPLTVLPTVNQNPSESRGTRMRVLPSLLVPFLLGHTQIMVEI